MFNINKNNNNENNTINVNDSKKYDEIIDGLEKITKKMDDLLLALAKDCKMETIKTINNLSYG